MSRSRFAAALSFSLLASPAFAQDAWVCDKTHSEVSFQIRHFVAKVRGNFRDFSCSVTTNSAKPEASSVEFTIKAASIDTDNERRDTHLKSADFFDVEKFPEISFRSSKVKPAGKDKYEVTGNLIMHGVTKEITLPVTFGGIMVTKNREGKEDPKSGFETSTTLNRKDFGIVYNRALDNGGTMLGDDVAVSINLEMVKPAPAAPAAAAAPKPN
jgi:polyisoprenoid-binding protein YceI